MCVVMVNAPLNSVQVFQAVKEKLNKILLFVQFKRKTLMLFYRFLITTRRTKSTSAACIQSLIWPDHSSVPVLSRSWRTKLHWVTSSFIILPTVIPHLIHPLQKIGPSKCTKLLFCMVPAHVYLRVGRNWMCQLTNGNTCQCGFPFLL